MVETCIYFDLSYEESESPVLQFPAYFHDVYRAIFFEKVINE